MTACPCGSGRGLDDCCGPIIAGAPAPTAEALMRSRYSAFTLANASYLKATLAPEIRGDFDAGETEETAKNTIWDGLAVQAVAAGGANDETGTVEFTARFRFRGERRVHHELASFRREGGQWMYDGGEINPKGPPCQVTKVGRNQSCPCGSGKKFKKCCGA